MSELEIRPDQNMRLATDAAGVCRDIVKKTAVTIQGRGYVRVEGWSSIAIAHGCILSARDVEKIDGGIRAIGEVRRMADGVVLATAEGFVGDDEPTWNKRPEYARRAMCQTRAMSRAARTCFAHVVTMIDSNLSTTPAEEVPVGGFDAPSDPVAALEDYGVMLGEEIPASAWDHKEQVDALLKAAGFKRSKIGGKWMCEKAA